MSRRRLYRETRRFCLHAVSRLSLCARERSRTEEISMHRSCAPFAVNASLLGMIVFRSWRITKEVGVQLPILRRMIKDGAGYFLAITVFNFINVYFYARESFTLIDRRRELTTHLRSEHIESIKVFNVCASVVIGSTLSCRLALSLLENKPTATTFPSFPRSSKPLSNPVSTPLTPRFDVQPTNVRLNRQESDETVTEKNEEAEVQGVESLSRSRSEEVEEPARMVEKMV